VLLLHYEALRGKRLLEKIVRRHWTLVVYDESQRLKARGSAASRASARFRDVDYKVILSGTPIEQCPQDLWAQFRFAMPEVFGTRWENFKNRWLYETGYMGYELKFQQERMPQFLKLIHPHIRRVLKKDVLDLPPLTYKRATVEMLGDQARVYRDVKKHMVARIQGETVTCDMAITQLVNLQQITSGFVRVDPTEAEMRAALLEQARTGRKKLRIKRRAVFFGNAKLRRLKRILQRVELPVVIFCKYKEELAMIARACTHLRVGIISGKMKKTRTATVDSFQRGELDVLVCQIRAGGVGLDLFAACHGIFFSCTFSSIDFEQAVARLHRRGQTRAVVFWLIQAENTVDKLIWTALLLKKSVTKLILDKRRK
jgi:SNF2 family DNA or RNA helicase